MRHKLFLEPILRKLGLFQAEGDSDCSNSESISQEVKEEGKRAENIRSVVIGPAQSSFLKLFENLPNYGMVPSFDDVDSEHAFALYKCSAMERRQLVFMSRCLSYAVLFWSVWNAAWNENEVVPDYQEDLMSKARWVYTAVLGTSSLADVLVMFGALPKKMTSNSCQVFYIFPVILMACPFVLEVVYSLPFLFWQSFLLTILHVFQISSILMRHSVPLVFATGFIYLIQATIKKEPQQHDSKLFLFFVFVIVVGMLLNFSRATECIQREAFKCWHHIRILDIKITQEIFIADAFLASQLPSALLQNQADLRMKEMIRDQKRMVGLNTSALLGKQLTENLLKCICDNEGCVERRFSAVVVAQLLGVDQQAGGSPKAGSSPQGSQQHPFFSGGSATVGGETKSVEPWERDLFNAPEEKGKVSILQYPELIGQIFDQFDRCCKQHGVEKVRSVGLCYVATSGLPHSLGTARRDALAALRLACDMIVITEALDVDLCVGVEAGLVVGGLIRMKPFSYSLLGDTLDTAMQLSQTCMAGQVFMGTRITTLLKRFWPSGKEKDQEQDLLDSIKDLQIHHTMPLFPNGERAKVAAISNPYKMSWWSETGQKIEMNKMDMTVTVQSSKNIQLNQKSGQSSSKKLPARKENRKLFFQASSSSPSLDKAKNYEKSKLESKDDPESGGGNESRLIKEKLADKYKSPQKVRLHESSSSKQLCAVVPVACWPGMDESDAVRWNRAIRHNQDLHVLQPDCITGMPLPVPFVQAMNFRRKVHGLGMRESALPIIDAVFLSGGPSTIGAGAFATSSQGQNSSDNAAAVGSDFSIGSRLNPILKHGTIKVKEVDLDALMKANKFMKPSIKLRTWLTVFKEPHVDKEYSLFRNSYFRHGQSKVFNCALQCFIAYNSLFFILSKQSTFLSGTLPHAITILVLLCMYLGCFLFGLALSILTQPSTFSHACHLFFLLCWFYIVHINAMISSKVEVLIHTCFSFAPLLHVRNNYAFTLAIIYFLGIVIRSHGEISNDYIIAIFPAICFLSLIMMIKWQAERRVIALYLSVVKVLWYKQSVYSYQKRDTNWMIDKVMPFQSLLSSLSKDDNKLVPCPEASVVYIEVLSLPKLNGLVSASDLCHFQTKILDLLECIAAELDALRVRVFAQGYVVLFGTLSGHANSHIEQSLEFIRQVEYKVDMFNQTNRIALGVSLGFTSGPVCIGFVGGQRSTFDVVGRAVDVAAMLCRWGEGVTTICGNTKALVDDAISKLQRKPCTKFIQKQPLVLPDNTTLETYELEFTPKRTAVPRVPKVEEFFVVRLLGKGSYGRVYLAKEQNQEFLPPIQLPGTSSFNDAHRAGFNLGSKGGVGDLQGVDQRGRGEMYAIKVLPKRLVEDVNEWMRVELAVLVQAQHPHVVSLKYCLQSKSKIYLVMEYIRGGTLKHIMKKETIKINDFQFWFAQLVLALEYIHALGIIHGDLKPENCMIGEDGHLKLIDFGLSTILPGKTRQVNKSPNWTRDAFQELPEHALALMQKIMPQRNGDNAELCNSSLRRSGLRGPNASSANKDLLKLSMSNHSHNSASSLSPKNSSRRQGASSGSRPPKQRNRRNNYMLRQLSSNKRRKILVVDADDYARAASKQILRAKNFEVFTAQNGKVALQKLREPDYAKMIDVILLDMNMPIMDGPTTLQQLQTDLQLKEIPVIMMSSDDATTALERCLRKGAKEFIIKPLQADSTGLLLRYAFLRKSEEDCNPTLVEEEEESSVISIRTMHSHTFTSERERRTSSTCNPNSIVGTPCYMAPEIITLKGYNSSVDWWALGILMYECCLGSVPFTGENLQAVFAAIKCGRINWMDLEEKSPNLKDLISKLLNPDRTNRIGAQKTKAHPYFASVDFENLTQTGKPPFFPTSTVNETPVTGKAREKAEKYFYSGEVKPKDRSPSPPTDPMGLESSIPAAKPEQMIENAMDEMKHFDKLKSPPRSPSPVASDEVKKSDASGLFDFKGFDAGESWDQTEQAILNSINNRKLQF